VLFRSVVKRLKEGERHDKLAIDALFRAHGSAG